MKTLHFRIIVLMLLVAGISSSTAKPVSTAKQEKLHQYVESYYNQGTFNGTVLVAEKGKVLLSEGYGYANIEFKVKNNPSTKFMLASISKTFTATAVMKLIDQGKLSLDTKLTDILQWYRKDTGIKVTIRHLLNHTSGIPNYLDMRGKSIYDVANEFGTAPINKVEFIKKYSQGDLEFEPSSKWNYNNSAYFLLGLIIEEVTGKPYEQVLQELIFEPLQMTNTGDIQPNPLKIVPNLAEGYTRKFTDYTQMAYWNLSTTYGAGSLYSTVGDLLKFDRALYDVNFISDAAREAMFTPNLNNYGCGWELRESPIGKDKSIKKIRTHEGFLFAWHTRFYQIPDDQYLIVVLSNGGGAPIAEMVGGITDILYDRTVQNVKPLVANDLWANFKHGNIEQALNRFENMSVNEKCNWDYNEYHLNGLGYTVLPVDKTAALKIFKFIIDVYPQSWNAWDSYGESLASSGLKIEAIKAYEKSIALNPENKGGIEMLKQLKSE